MNATQDRHIVLRRTIALYRFLVTAKPWTVANLAQRFGVDRRTLYRDLHALEAAGVPLDWGGHGVGVSLKGGCCPMCGTSLGRRTSAAKPTAKKRTAKKPAARKPATKAKKPTARPKAKPKPKARPRTRRA